MAKVYLTPEPGDEPIAMAALWQTAGQLLVELVKAKGGGGPWFSELHDRLRAVELRVGDGSSLGDPAAVYRETVDAVFKQVRFTDDPNPPASHH